MKNGFTIIELMIVVTIVGILAAVAVVGYAEYVTRARVSEGFPIAAVVKKAVAEYRFTTAAFPTSNADIGLPVNVNTEFVNTVVLSGQGVITISYKAAAGVTAGLAIQFVPTLNASGSVVWACNGAGTTVPDRFLPANCR